MSRRFVVATLVVIVAALAGGCSTTGGGTASGGSTTLTPLPAGPTPSPISVQVCSKEAQREIASSLGEKAVVSSPTWVDHRYSCTYTYPSGSFSVAVQELSSWPATYAFFDAQRSTLGTQQNLGSLGQAAFQGQNGTVVVRKQWKVLLVNPVSLPSQFGKPPTSSGSVAVTVADIILGCWSGD